MARSEVSQLVSAMTYTLSYLGLDPSSEGSELEELARLLGSMAIDRVDGDVEVGEIEREEMRGYANGWDVDRLR